MSNRSETHHRTEKTDKGDQRDGGRLVIASNRLPVSIRKQDGRWQVGPSSGGLVTAMGPVLRNRGGIWLGWPGVTTEVDAERLLAEDTSTIGYSLVPVEMTAQERDDFYYGFANEIIWPLFHGLQSLPNYEPDYWRTYRDINRRFAERIVTHVRPGDFVWIHDYHLMNVGQELRRLGVTTPIGFFLHIPFPPLDVYHKLPWAWQVLEAMVDYDLIGFQTMRHRRNFLHCARSGLRRRIGARGRGPVLQLEFDDREMLIGAFPIGIDFVSFHEQAQSEDVATMAWRIKEELEHRCLILGVDRLDYTKGLPYKLRAFRQALRDYPELCENVTLTQVVVPSRENIPEYQMLLEDIERLVSQINGEFTRPGWVPVHYIHRSLTRTELLAYYRAARIALVTPLEDGMNLVAKEFCACSVEEGSSLILSEFAGAANQLQRGAILVNPYDIEGMAAAIYKAFRMDVHESRVRMRRMQRVVRDQDIFWWVESFLKAGVEKDLQSFPTVEEYSQSEEPEGWFSGVELGPNPV